MFKETFNLQLLPAFFGFLLTAFGAIVFVIEPLILNDIFQVTDFEGAHQKVLLTIAGSIFLGAVSLGIWVFKFLKSN